LLADTHRLNFVGLYDANHSNLLDKPLLDIETETLELKLVSTIENMIETLKAEKQAKILKEIENDAKNKAAKKKKNEKFKATNFDQNDTKTNGKRKILDSETKVDPKLKKISGQFVDTPFDYNCWKLTKSQRKKGSGIAIKHIVSSDAFAEWTETNLKLSIENFKDFSKKFPLPFIYDEISMVTPCVICQQTLTSADVPGDATQTRHCNSAEHKEKCKIFCESIDSACEYNVPFQLTCLMLGYCSKCKVVTVNWNSSICHLETHFLKS